MIAQSVQKSFERSFGTACFLAFFALLFFRHTEAMMGSYLPYAALMSVLFVAALAVCAHLADRLDSWGPAWLSVIACILCSSGMLLLEAPPTPLLFVLGGLLALLGCTAFFLVLGKSTAFYDHAERLCLLSTAFIAGMVIVALVAALASFAAFVVTLMLPALTALHLCTLKPNKGTFFFADLKTTRKSHRFSLTTLLTTALTGLVWGIAFCFIIRFDGAAPSVSLGFALPIALGGLLCLVDTAKGKMLSEGALLRCFAIVVFVTVAPLPFVSSQAQQIIGAALFFAFSLDTIFCFSAMGEVARFNQISPYWVFGVSLAFYFSGAVVGFLGFMWAFSQEVVLFQLGVCFVALLATIVGSSYLFQDSYPCSESIADMAETSKKLSENERQPALWKRKINQVCEEFELTARQQEVFRMLVRGRNAQYIAENFFISNSTAKAHIHNIYQKLDIHSQQELINLVESAEVPAGADAGPAMAATVPSERAGQPGEPQQDGETRMGSGIKRTSALFVRASNHIR